MRYLFRSSKGLKPCITQLRWFTRHACATLGITLHDFNHLYFVGWGQGGGAYWVPCLLWSFVSLLRKPDSSPTTKSRTHASTAWIFRMVELPRSLTNFLPNGPFSQFLAPNKDWSEYYTKLQRVLSHQNLTISLQSDINKWHVWNTRNHNSRASNYTKVRQVQSVPVSRLLKTAASK
jgi:hypothetical protein